MRIKNYKTQLLILSFIFLLVLPVVNAENVQFKNVVIILIDAIPSERLYWGYENSGNRIFSNSVYFINTTTIFPGSSPAAHPSIFTGRYPVIHSSNGINWFDRTTATYRTYNIGLETEPVLPFLGVNDDLQADTIYKKANESGIKSQVIGEFIEKDATHINYEAYPLVGISVVSTNKFVIKTIEQIMGVLAEEHLSDPYNITVVYLQGYHDVSGYSGTDTDDANDMILNEISVVDNIYGKLASLNKSEDTVIVVISDHGQSDVNSSLAISREDIESVLECEDFATEPKTNYLLLKDYSNTTAVVATIGNSAYVYLKFNQSSYSIPWEAYPTNATVNRAAQALYDYGTGIDKVLVRYEGESEYKVYTGNNNSASLDSLNPSDYPFANRVNMLYPQRAGDIIILPNVESGYYILNEESEGMHGGLYRTDTFVPMMYISPRFGGCNYADVNYSVLDMAPTLADLMNFNMGEYDGKSLATQLQDCFRYYDGELVNLTFTVENQGSSNAYDVNVSFYDGNISDGGVYIGSSIADVVEAGGSKQVGVSWIIPNANNHTIFVEIDPQDDIEETDEANNQAYSTILVKPEPPTNETEGILGIINSLDPLAYFSGFETTSAPTGGDNSSIDKYVNVEISGSFNYFLLKIPYNSSALTVPEETLKVHWWNETASEWLEEAITGVDTINKYVWALIDHNTIFTAIGEDMPDFNSTLNVTPQSLYENQIITINATVTNDGTLASTTSSAEISIIVATPTGAEEIHNSSIGMLDIGEEYHVDLTWNVTNNTGTNHIYVIADNKDSVEEIDETNNIAAFNYTVIAHSKVDISILDPLTSSETVYQNQFFDFVVNVTCLINDCGNVTVTLDPDLSSTTQDNEIIIINPTTTTTLDDSTTSTILGTTSTTTTMEPTTTTSTIESTTTTLTETTTTTIGETTTTTLQPETTTSTTATTQTTTTTSMETTTTLPHAESDLEFDEPRYYVLFKRDKSVEVTSKDSTLSFTLKPTHSQEQHYESATLSLLGDKPVYQDILGDGIDIEYEMLEDSIKESIIIDSPESLSSSTTDFTIEYVLGYASDLTPVIEGNEWCGGEVTTEHKIPFKTRSLPGRLYPDHEYFTIQKPFITDSQGEMMESSYTLYGDNESPTLRLNLPYEWLSNARYPVTIDPTISIKQSNIPYLAFDNCDKTDCDGSGSMSYVMLYGGDLDVGEWEISWWSYNISKLVGNATIDIKSVSINSTSVDDCDALSDGLSTSDDLTLNMLHDSFGSTIGCGNISIDSTEVVTVCEMGPDPVTCDCIWSEDITDMMQQYYLSQNKTEASFKLHLDVEPGDCGSDTVVDISFPTGQNSVFLEYTIGCVDHGECSGGEYCNKDGDCLTQVSDGGDCEDKEQEGSDPDDVCSGGYCYPDDYDDSGEFCSSLANGCVHDGSQYSQNYRYCDGQSYRTCIGGGSGTWNDTQVTCTSTCVSGGGCKPYVTLAYILPSSPAYSENLECNHLGLGDDDDTPTAYYRWFKNGELIGDETSNTLEYSEYTIGDDILCEVTPGDEYLNGTAVNSTSVTIGKGAIPMNSGTPFYTTSQNPYDCGTLTYGQSCSPSWSVNATGTIGNSYEFTIEVETTEGIYSTTDPVNITIQLEPGCTGESCPEYGDWNVTSDNTCTTNDIYVNGTMRVIESTFTARELTVTIADSKIELDNGTFKMWDGVLNFD